MSPEQTPRPESAHPGRRPVRALVLTELGARAAVRHIRLSAPRGDQVRVRLRAAGVCRSDAMLRHTTPTGRLPTVLGHEGVGVVNDVGGLVRRVQVGDKVLLDWLPGCGECRPCRRLEPHLCISVGEFGAEPHATLMDGTPVYPSMGIGAFAEETLVPEGAVVRLPPGLPEAESALLGCAVLTGFGAVDTCARVTRGESVAVYGIGGVGTAVLRAAQLADASPIVAVDISPGREAAARGHGATHFIRSHPACDAQVRAITGGYGADVTIECAGTPETILLAWRSTRRGGRTVVAGLCEPAAQITLPATELLYSARSLTSCIRGNTDASRDIGRLADVIRSGALDLTALASSRIVLAEAASALDRLGEDGTGGRPLITF